VSKAEKRTSKSKEEGNYKDEIEGKGKAFVLFYAMLFSFFGFAEKLKLKRNRLH
jgi:hypothetical protein